MKVKPFNTVHYGSLNFSNLTWMWRTKGEYRDKISVNPAKNEQSDPLLSKKINLYKGHRKSGWKGSSWEKLWLNRTDSTIIQDN